MIKIKKIFLIILILLFTTSFFLYYIDKRLNEILSGYIDSEIEKIASYSVGEIIKKIEHNDPSSYLNITRDSDGNIERVSYNVVEINNLKNKALKLTHDEFIKIEKGIYDGESFVQHESGKKKYKYISKGYLCEVNFSSIRGSTLFGNVGPSIPIKLSFMGYSNVDVDVDIQEYGINNVMVQVNIIVNLNSVVTMPLSSRTHNIKIKEPISIELIKGTVPSYISGIG